MAHDRCGIHVEPTADVAEDAELGADTTVWHLAQVRELASVGMECTIGRGAYLGPGVQLGARCKIQNYALVYEPAVLADGVFVGPAAVLTNDLYPRAVNPDGQLLGPDDWTSVGVQLREGSSIGARAVCVAPVTVGRWAMVAAGSVVTRDVADFSLVAGSPARHVRWVGRSGRALTEVDGAWVCPVTGQRYVEADGTLTEEAPRV